MKRIKSIAIKFIAVAFALITMLANPAVILAQTAPVPQVTITFDDGFLSTYTNALPILSARNIPATIYPNTSSMNTGAMADGFPAMSWAQLESLQNDHGWEVGGHTNTHPELPTLTQPQIANELATSNADLAAHGLNVTNFASPFGAYDNKVLVEALKVYNSHRGFQDRDTLDIFPYNRAILTVQSIENNIAPSVVKGWIDQAIANNQWLILVYHDVQPTYNPAYIYTETNAQLAEVADYIVSTGIKVVTVEEGLQKPGVNVVPNSDFSNGMTDWNTDNATQVTVDSANNGAYSETPNQNAVKVTGGAGAAHLFSTLVDAVPGANYLLEAFYNTIGLTSGELGFYMDEYDASNNWISGQWLGMVANNAVGYFTKLYTTTSAAVAKLRVQTYLTANSAGTAFVDNVVVNNTNASPAPTATPSATPTATPTATPAATAPGFANMIQNPEFEDGLNHWTTDNASTVQLSGEAVSMTGSSVSSHLFQGLIAVNPTAAYTFSALVNATGLTSGELGFYIDEYDATSNWISGKWLGAVVNGVTSTFTKAYQATSTAVNAIRVQTYNFRNSVGTAIVDNFSLTDNATPVATATPTATPSGTPVATASPTSSPIVSPTASSTPTATPVATNLVANPSFETALSGWATDWTRQTNEWLLDTASNGNNGTNSAKLVSNGVRTHLFSSQMSVNPVVSYIWKTYVKILSLTGEFGFYVDEYDVNGNWISGQWKGMQTAAFTGVVTINYTPTSASVAKVGLQYYFTTGSIGEIIIDSVSLSQ